MGYDLHITRGGRNSKEWKAIAYEEWNQIAASDPDLEVVGSIGDQPIYTLKDCDIDPSFYYSGASSTVHIRGGCSAEVLGKLLELAAKLDAVVQGDEGEYYRLTDQGVETSWEPPSAKV